MKNQCKCGSLDFFTQKQGSNTGLYCSMCGKWQKWLSKDEIRLFEHIHKPKKKSKINQTNADKIRAMDDEELAEFFIHTKTNCELCNCLTNECLMDCSNGILDWLKSEAE